MILVKLKTQSEQQKKDEIVIFHRKLSWWKGKGVMLLTHPLWSLRLIGYNAKKVFTDLLNYVGCYRYPYPIIFIAGLPLSGSTWMKTLLAKIPGYFTRPAPMPFAIKDRGDICDTAFRHVPRRGNTLFKTHLRPSQDNHDCIMRNGVKKVLITYRDLRDVVIARYYRLMEFPWPKDHHNYVDYRAVGKEEALKHCIETVSSKFVPWIQGWRKIAEENPSQYLLVKFEDLKKDTRGTFGKVLDFYEIKMSDKNILKIIEQSKGKGTMKENMNAAQILPWGHSSNFRSGKIGNWKSEFSDTHINRCKNLMGEILIELGYEKDLNW